MPTERIFVLTFSLLLVIALLSFFMNKQLGKAESGEEEGIVKMQHYDFVQQVYPPLITAHNKLSRQINQLNDLQQQILTLRKAHPQRADHLQFAYNQWLYERKDLSQLKLKLDRGVRNAWIQYRTQDKTVISSAFNRQAVDWEKIISDRLGELQDSQLKVNNKMLENVTKQNTNLDRLRRGKNSNFATSGAVFRSAFSSETTATLLEYFDETSPDLAGIFNEMGDEINIASQRGREVRNYALDNPDLQPTLDKVTNSWLQLENKSIYYRDQILHAIQGRYLAILLGTNKRENQIRRMNRTLKAKIPELYSEIQKARASLEKSYKTGLR